MSDEGFASRDLGRGWGGPLGEGGGVEGGPSAVAQLARAKGHLPTSNRLIHYVGIISDH